MACNSPPPPDPGVDRYALAVVIYEKLAAALEAALERGGGAVAAPVAVAPVRAKPAAAAPLPVTPTEADEFVGALRGDPLAAWLTGAVAVALVAVVGRLWVRGGG